MPADFSVAAQTVVVGDITIQMGYLVADSGQCVMIITDAGAATVTEIKFTRNAGIISYQGTPFSGDQAAVGVQTTLQVTQGGA